MAEVASAFVTLAPSLRGFGAKTSSLIDPELAKAGKSGGSKLSGALGGFLKKSALGIGVAAGGILGTALFSGFKRLDAIDQAKAKLTGLGNSAGTVAKIMDNALASVKGTAFGLDEASSIAAGAVAAGIKPGQQLTKTLKLVADAATIGGTSLSEMGQVFNKVATSNKVQGDVINQLNDKGIPIVQLLGKTMHATSDEVMAMSKKGTISFADFSKAMQAGLGGAALKSGDTFSGAFANMKAALARFGAGLLTGIFPIVKQVFGGITGLLDKVTAKVQPFADAFAAKIPGALKAVGAAVKGLFASASGSGALSAAFDSIKGTVANLVSGFMLLVPPVKAVFAAFAPTALVVIKAAFIALLATASGLASVFSSVLAPALAATLGWIANNAGPVLAFVGVLAAFKTAVVVISTATKLWAAAQLLLDAALTANPIGLVVVAVAALAAGLVYAYQHSETFRNIVNAAFTVIKTVVIGSVTAVVGFVKAHWPLLLAIIAGPLGVAVGLVIRNWAQIKAATSAAWNAVKAVTSSVWNGLKAVVSGAVNGIKAAVSAGFGAVKAVVSAQWHAVRAVTSAAWSGIRAVVSAAAHGISAVVSGAMGAIRGAVSGAFHAAQAVVSGAMNAIKGAVSGGTSRVVGLFVSLKGRIIGALSGLGGALAGIGVNIVQGLIGGIGSMAGAVSGALLALIPGPLKKFAGKLGIGSPSKVFHKFGVNIGEGLVNGIHSQRSAVGKAAVRLAETAKKAAAAAAKKAVEAAAKKRKDVRAAFAGFSLDNVLPKADDPNVITAAMRDALSSLKKQVTDAGGVWTKSLKTWSSGLVTSALRLDKETRKRDALSAVLDTSKQALTDLTSAAKDFATSVGSKFLTDAFAAQSGDGAPSALSFFDSTVASDTASAQAFETALKGAVTKGLDGALFADVANSGNVQLAEALAGLTSTQIDLREQAYATRAQAADALGAYSSAQAFDKQLSAQNGLISKQTATLDALNAQIQAGIRAIIVQKDVHAAVIRQATVSKRQTGTTGIPA